MYKLLDMKDKRILTELDINSRQPTSGIAKKVGLSQQVVDYRIRRLEEGDIILGYYTLINHSKIGCIYGLVLLKLQFTDDILEKEIIEHLRKIQSVSWLGSLNGQWDIAVSIFIKDIIDFKTILDQFINKFKKYIFDKEISFRTNLYCFNHDYTSTVNSQLYSRLGGEVENDYIDDSDKLILSKVAENARMSVLGLSKQTKLSIKNVVERIKRLEKNKVILGYKPILNLEKLGYSYYHIYINFNELNFELRKQVFTFLKNMHNIMFIIEAVSKHDFEFEMLTTSPSEIDKIMASFKIRFKDNLRNYTFDYMKKVYKTNYYYS